MRNVLAVEDQKSMQYISKETSKTCLNCEDIKRDSIYSEPRSIPDYGEVSAVNPQLEVDL